jgi:hypothetical protein
LQDIHQFVRSYELCNGFRFKAFVRGVDIVGPDEARSLGVHATMDVPKLQTEGQRAKLSESVEAFRAVHDGVEPSEQTVRQYVRQIAPKAETPAAVRKVGEMGDLRAKCKALETEVRRLEKENAKLRKELDKYTATAAE